MSRVRQFVVRLQDPAQLFMANPPSPSSPDYTEFTAQPAMDTVRDLLLMRRPPKDAEIQLVVVLPKDKITPGLQDQLQRSVRRWIVVQNRLDVEKTSATGAVGRRLFVISCLVFLALQTLALIVRNLGDQLDNLVVDAVGEGLSVASWVILWVPVQMFTVEMWRGSIWRRRMAHMEQMTVLVRDEEQAEA
jgi:hypothetical protein